MADLGKLQRLSAREAWAHEAADFTPWLLANASALGDAMGMDLELSSSEHGVGAFWLDLIGRDLATGEKVIVENQIEKSDHSHLGQLLTYAAGTDAANIVWIADGSVQSIARRLTGLTRELMNTLVFSECKSV